MPRESTPAKAARARQIISVLKKTYPDFRCELNFANPLQLLIATILSAQCTDKRVNMVTPNLFKKYRTAADFAAARIEELEELIKTTGFFHNKAKNIKGCCQGLVEKHGGEVPKTMDDLHALPGVGRKTANVVLAEAFRISVGVIVDTHVTRLTNRFGIIKGSDAVKIETELMKLVPQEDWIAFSHCLVWHGRRRCDARKPDCGRCEITDVCPKLGVK
ncbi:MAG: endonuclease III [Verrucomicrobia bacterium]|jgi:endonuclease-3|nr:MAG: endonuclease III [Verrucomicrobiota bacterium]